jgi:hypothetical protein
MTTVRLNSEGIDIVELKLETTGTNFCHFTSNDNLLNSDLEYIFAVTDLNVDCSKLPIFAPATDEVILNIRKRHLGSTLTNTTDANVNTHTLQVTPNGSKYYDVTSFIAALSTFANTFSQELDAVGINAATHGGGVNIVAGHMANEGIPYLKIGMDASGRIEIEGVAQFWNHFVIGISDFGLKLLQFEHLAVGNHLSVTLDVGLGVYTTDGIPPVVVGANVTYPITGGANLTATSLLAQKSILTFGDQRLYLTCDTHLSVKTNMKVLNGKEKTDTSIIRVPFLNEAVSTIYSRNGEIVEDVSLTTKSYAGRMSFVNKTEQIRQWNQLISSYEQKIFRFQLYVIYNVFANGEFSQVKKDVQFDKDGSWDLTLRFVNKI